MRARVGWQVLLAVAAVGAVASLSAIFDKPGWGKISLAVGLAIAAAFVPSYVDWLIKRATARRRAAAVPERAPPEGPADLLRADRHVVPFNGRDREYVELREWCRDDNSPVRLLIGAGGVGKTRLALHLGEYLTSCGWLFRVVGAGREADALSDLRATTRRSILLVVDYAETRTGLVDLLRSVPGHSARVRVLLIARGVGDWWRELGSDGPMARKLVQAYPPMELSTELDEHTGRADLVRAAVPCFAKALGVAAPSHIEVTVPAEVPLLVLHAAALVAVLRYQRRDQWASAGRLVADLGVLDELLGHEQRYWAQSAARAGLGGLSSAVLQRAVAVACLFPAEDENDGAESLRRVPDLADDMRLRRHVARWLQQLYPSDTGLWGTLQPELVTETHVIAQLRVCPELLMTDPHTLRADQADQMLTVLSMATTRRPADRAPLERVLRADPGRLVSMALTVATATGGGLRTVLVRVLATVPLEPATLREIDQQIPYPTTVLSGAAVVVARRILKALPAGTDAAERAHWQARLGVVEAQAGRRAAALRDTRAAAEQYRTLVAENRRRFRPDLARCLHNLGMRLAEQGRQAEALEHAQEAVRHYQALGDPPARYRPDLAACRNNIGTWLIELDRHREALPSLEQSVQSYRELVEIDRDRHLGDLANALTNLDLCRAALPEERVEPLPQLLDAGGGAFALPHAGRSEPRSAPAGPCGLPERRGLRPLPAASAR